MTRNEAFKVLFALPQYDVYVNRDTVTLNEIEDPKYDELLAYFESLPFSLQFMLDFVNGDTDFATMDNKRTGDEFDYLQLLRDDEGNIQLGCWTEVCGIEYWLKDYGIKWKEYTKSDEELAEEKRKEEEYSAEREKYKEEWKKFCLDLKNKAIPSLVGDDIVQPRPVVVVDMKCYEEVLAEQENKPTPWAETENN